MRTKKAFINFLGDFLPQIVILVINFFKVKVLLQCLGDEQLGIFNLFGQLVVYLSFADIGISSAMMSYLYSPLGKKDHQKTSEIFSAMLRVFHWISLIVSMGGAIITCFIMFFIGETTMTESSIQLMFSLFLVSNVLGYFLVPYNTIFDSDQKRYKYNIYYQIILIVKSLVEIAVAYIFKSIIPLIWILIIMNIIKYILIRILFRKEYPEIVPTKKRDYGFMKSAKDLLFHKIGGIIAYNVDIVIISKFIGLIQVTRYTIYISITEALRTLVEKIVMAVMPGIGNLIAMEKEKVYQVFLEFNSLLFYIAICLCAPLQVCFNKFIELWYGAEYVEGPFVVITLVALLFYNIIRIALSTYTSAACLFKETVINVVLEFTINLILSLLLVNSFGILGVLVGTIVAYFISEYCIKPFILNKHLFHANIWTYYIDNIKFLLIYIGMIILLTLGCNLFSISSLFVWFLLSGLMFILNFMVVSLFFKAINRFSFFDRFKNMILKKG